MSDLRYPVFFSHASGVFAVPVSSRAAVPLISCMSGLTWALKVVGFYARATSAASEAGMRSEINGFLVADAPLTSNSSLPPWIEKSSVTILALG